VVVCSPPDVVSPAIEPFWREMEQTDTFSFIGQRLRSTPSQGCCLLEHLRVWPELCRACTVVGGGFLSGFVLYGIPVGLSRLVKHHIPRKIAKVAMEVREVLEVLQGEGQASGQHYHDA
jgi:hypothetical protein